MQTLTELVMAVAGFVGTNSFYRHAMHKMYEAVPSDDCQVIHYPGRGRPQYVVDDHTQERFRQLYRKFCQYDPFYRDWCSSHRAGLRRLRDVQPPDYDEGGYYSGFYSVTGYTDEMGLIFPALSGSAVGVFVQRARAYDDVEVEFLSRLFPVLRRLHIVHRTQLFRALATDHACSERSRVAIVEPSGRIACANASLRAVAGHEQAVIEAVRCHAATNSMTVITRIGPATITNLGSFPLAPSSHLLVFGRYSNRACDLDRALTTFGEGLLSRREHQICCLAFSGLGNMHIAEVLGIGEGTVKNLRKRLYSKMDITAERELFALFLQHLRDSE